jgi:two-component system chemotaxis response regulator CheB
MIRVVLVDDSVVQREILRRILGDNRSFTIVGEARNGTEAVRTVEECRPDVVLIDIHMPDMNGVDATREIMRRCPVPIVVASATLRKHDIDMGLEALNAGAFSVIAKPEGAVLLNLEKIASKLRDEITMASRVKLKAPIARAVKPKRVVAGRPARVKVLQAIGICASTGGPPVLVDILSALPRPFSAPVLLVQHITQGFEKGFAAWLAERTSQPVALATDGQRLGSGVWMAPAGRHLILSSPGSVALVEPAATEIHCPSGNPLFASLARHLSSRAAGVLLTGMGDDGARGLLQLKEAGGTTVIQDEASSLIWGMPKAGRDLNAAGYELSPPEIALLLTEMT